MEDGKKSGLQKLVERLVDERLREVLPRIEEAVLQAGLGELLREEMQEKVARVEGQLDAVHQAMRRELAALRSYCGQNGGQEQEALRGRMQQAEAVTGQVQGRIAGIQAGLRSLQRKSSFEVKHVGRLESKDASGALLEGKATEDRRPEPKSVGPPQQPPESKLSGGGEQRSESKSKGVTDNLWRMRQLLTEQFNEKSKSPSYQGCSIPEEQLERELRELRCVAEREEECNSPVGLVWEPLAARQDDPAHKDVGGIEPPSACSTITLFDSRAESKEDANPSQRSLASEPPAA